jgi:hypothetical protein
MGFTEDADMTPSKGYNHPFEGVCQTQKDQDLIQ